MRRPSWRQDWGWLLFAGLVLLLVATGPKRHLSSIPPIWYLFPITVAAICTYDAMRKGTSRWPLPALFVAYAGAMYSAGAVLIVLSGALDIAPWTSWLDTEWDVGPVGFVLFAIGAMALVRASYLFGRRLDAHERSSADPFL